MNIIVLSKGLKTKIEDASDVREPKLTLFGRQFLLLKGLWTTHTHRFKLSKQEREDSLLLLDSLKETF